MKTTAMKYIFFLIAMLIAGCSENQDPLAPGSMDGQYSIGTKGLVPLNIGNRWTYSVVLYDTTGIERKRYTYTLSVKDTISADTGKIPLVSPSIDRKSIKREALVWYLLQGESGVTTCWQVDTLENLRIRKSDDTRFYEQTAFNFRAAVGDTTFARYIGGDTMVWASGDIIYTTADSVRSSLVSKGVDTLRTTLGSAPYFYYRESYKVRTDYTNYYFKPGFGLLLIEKYQRTAGGTTVRVRRDELVSYYFK
jgi:hypothetical protein